ncbi:hypothetical protein KW805_03280 [Candidatus Pacearchaeota archaeon]|nr:hypothetical protein [Candidatus Pacearchaeota archaeon]
MSEETPLIKKEDLRIEKLDTRHVAIIREFKSSEKELEDFLVEDALNNQEMGISTTYLIFYNPLNKLVAYVTLCNDAIRVHGTRLGKSFTDKGVDYKTLPALKICRVSTEKSFERRGIGRFIMYFVMRRTMEVHERCACRFIVVDAKHDSIGYYKQMQFEVLKQRDKGTLPMYFDMIKIIRYFKEKKPRLTDQAIK